MKGFMVLQYLLGQASAARLQLVNAGHQTP
jgi:hypothetical protein